MTDTMLSVPRLAARLILAVAPVTVLAAPAVEAQVIQGVLSAGGGAATDQRGIRSNAATIAPSIRYSPDPRLSLGAGLNAARFTSDESALGGTVTAGARVPVWNGVALSASALAATTSTSFDARYSSAEVVPTVEASIARVTLFAGARLAQGSTTIRETGSAPGGLLTAPTMSARDVRTSRSSTGPVVGALARLAGPRPGSSGTLGYREERARVSGLTVTDRTVSGALSDDRFALAATAGRRDAVDESIGFGSVTATAAVARAVAVQGSLGTYASNRVIGTLGGRFASLGVVLYATRSLAQRLPGTPQLAGAPPVPAGARRLVLRAPGARRVELAGDWNGWSATPAIRARDDSWYADVRLPRGEYRYAFKVDGARWTVPESGSSVDDGFGGRSAVLVVGEGR